MKFPIRAKLDDTLKRMSFSVPLERALAKTSDVYVDKLKDQIADLFDVQVESLSMFDGDEDKVVVKNDKQLINAILRASGPARLFVKEKPGKGKKKSAKCDCKGKKIKKTGKKEKQSRKVVDNGDVSDSDSGSSIGYCKPGYKVVDMGSSSCSDDSSTTSDSSNECHLKKIREWCAATSVCSKNSRRVPRGTLECGDEGDGVKMLQKRLNDLGFLEKSSYTAGRFGRSTARAVKDFRKLYAVQGEDESKYDKNTAKVMKALVEDLIPH